MLLVTSRLILALLAVAAMSACAPVADRSEDARPRVLVYPEPPDEPRFYFERSFRTEADVEPEDEGASLIRQLTGQSRSVQGLAKPYAVAARLGRVYVTDTAARTVHIFDVPGRRYLRVGEDAEVFLAKPLGIDVDSQGNLYVADVTLKIVRIYDRDGKHLRDIGAKGDFDRPSSVAVDLDGSRVYVVDIGGIESTNHRVRVFDGPSGEFLFDIGTRGTGEGQFNLPRDVAIGKDGQLYVVDGGNFRVQAFDRDGKFLNQWGKVGKQVGDFARPKEVATDSAGNVYVVDTAFGNFQIFSPEGETLLFIGNRGGDGGPASYALPTGIAVDEDGRVYVADQWYRKVDVYRPAGLAAGTGALSARKSAGSAAK